MGSILQTTLNTRALPTGNFRYVRSDYPGKLTDDEVRWLYQNDITTIVDLREEKEYVSRPWGIPVRTLEDWEAGRRTPPDYIPRLIAYQLKYEELMKGMGEKLL